MPTDLDDLFAGLAHQADMVPLGPVDGAVRRGRQRRRRRVATIAAALAVGLVTAGVAGVLGRPLGHDDQPAGHGLREVGVPVPLGGTVRDVRTVVNGNRVITAWQTTTGEFGAVGTDPRDGAVTWRIDHIAGRGSDSALTDLRAPGAAGLVSIATSDGSLMNIIDPARTPAGWSLSVGPQEQLISTGPVLLRWSATTGETDGYDWATGTKRWSMPAAADPMVRTVGMRTAGDPARDSFGDTLVQVTRSGRIKVLDAGTGQVVRTALMPAPAADAQLTAIDGWLYNDEPATGVGYRVRATDLRSANGASTVVMNAGSGHRFGGLDVCGPNRVCVLDLHDNDNSVTAVDIATQQTRWQTPAPADAASISSRAETMLVGGGRTTTLLNAAGREVFRTTDTQVDWLTDDRLLSMPALAAGPVTTVRTTNGRATTIGRVPAHIGPCQHTSDRLICATTTSLHFYQLPD